MVYNDDDSSIEERSFKSNDEFGEENEDQLDVPEEINDFGADDEGY